MRSLNPACKFLGLLVLTFVLAARRDPVWNLVFFALSAAALLTSRVRVRTLLLLMLPVALSALGMFFTGYHFSADGSMPVRADAFLALVSVSTPEPWLWPPTIINTWS